MTDIKEAGVMLIILDGLILGVSRRNDPNKFGLPGGKRDIGDASPKDTAIRETLEETGIVVNKCVFLYKRVELGDGPDGVDYHSYCYFATSWTNDPRTIEDGINVKWITAAEITHKDAPFGDYNRKTLDIFKTMYPNYLIKGE